MKYSIVAEGTVKSADGREEQTCITYTVEEEQGMTIGKVKTLAFSSVEHVIRQAISTTPEVTKAELKFTLRKHEEAPNWLISTPD